MKVEQSLEYPIKWESIGVGEEAKMIRITCGDESIILKGQAVYSRSDRGLAQYSHEILVVSKQSEVET